MILKQNLLLSLPIIKDNDTIRPWGRNDVDLLGSWRSYPFPYGSFNYSIGAMTPAERDRHFKQKEENPDRITLVLDHKDQTAVGYLALVDIDWIASKVGNMAVRVAPDWCDKGLGSLLVRSVTAWGFSVGFKSMRLDVAASNQRAVNCYKKSGYSVIGEFWRNDENLKEMALGGPEFDFLRPHVRTVGKESQLRFYRMEARNDGVIKRQVSIQ